MSLQTPVTPPGIDPRTVRLVAQRLNHYATQTPTGAIKNTKYSSISRLQAVPDRALLCFRRCLWPYIESGDKSKCCTLGNFCAQSFLGAMWRRRYIAIWLHILQVSFQLPNESKVVWKKNFTWNFWFWKVPTFCNLSYVRSRIFFVAKNIGLIKTQD